jgi:tRNA dimethylallyltransferase
MNPRYLIVLAGPTAVGKTGTAIRLARYLGTEIISADSRQVYREMKTGTAAPSAIQLAEVRHHLVGHRSIHEYYNASLFELEAVEILESLFTHHNTVILTGGSGMYIEAVCQGIDDIPSVDPEIRNRLQREYMENGLTGIRHRLFSADPEYYKRADLNNPKRILKALEISEMTGRPYSAFLTGHAKERNFLPVRIGLNIPREELHANINRRVDSMVSEGLVDEARKLHAFRELNALNTVGYKELFDYFEKRCSLDEAVQKIKDHTRQYARRQLTWFRKQKDTKWFLPDEDELMLKYIHETMERNEHDGNKEVQP